MKQEKRINFSILLFSAFLSFFLSCENHVKGGLTLIFPTSVIKEVTSRSAENDDFEYLLKLELLLDGKNSAEKTATFKKTSKDSIAISFAGLPLGHKVKILASISANDKELASGESDEIIINDEENFVKLKLKLESQEPSSEKEENEVSGDSEEGVTDGDDEAEEGGAGAEDDEEELPEEEPPEEEPPEEDEPQEADTSGTLVLHFTPGLVFSIEADEKLYLNNGKVAVSVKDADGTELPSENISAKLYFSGREVDSELYSFKDSVVTILQERVIHNSEILDTGELDEWDTTEPLCLEYPGLYQLYVTAKCNIEDKFYYQSSTFNITVQPEYKFIWDVTPYSETYDDGTVEICDPSFDHLISNFNVIYPNDYPVQVLVMGNPRNITYAQAIQNNEANPINELKLFEELKNFSNAFVNRSPCTVDMSGLGENFTYISDVAGNYYMYCYYIGKIILPPGLKIIIAGSFSNADSTEFVLEPGTWYATENLDVLDRWATTEENPITEEDESAIGDTIFVYTSEEVAEVLAQNSCSLYFYRVGE